MNWKLPAIDWQSFAPYGAGSPPALVLAFNLYRAIVAAERDAWLFAAFAAFLGVLFTIVIEAELYKAFAVFFADGDKKAAIVAAIGALIITSMVVFGVYNGDNTRALVSSSVFMIGGYLVGMLNAYRKKREQVTQQARAQVISEQDKKDAAALALLKAEAEIEKQRANQERAKARAAKTAQAAPVNLGNNSENIGSFVEISEPKKTRWNEIKREEYAWIAQASTAEIVAKYGIDERSARNWRKSAGA